MLLLAGLLLPGCPRSDSPDSAASPTKASQRAPDLSGFTAFVSFEPDGGSAVETFAGFSRDERRFAWSSYSVGAGGHVLTVVAPSDDQVPPTKLLVTDDPSRAEAQRLLDAQGFSPARRVPASDAAVRVVWRGRSVRLLQGEQVLYEGEPFGDGLAVPAGASFWGLSPSGGYAVLEAISAHHPEFGSARSFVFIPLQSPQEPR